MAANVDFRVPGMDLSLNGSGLGFFGSTFGASVLVGQYQDTTYATDGNGTTNLFQGNNIKYLNTASGTVNSATSGVPLTAIANKDSTLNIRFTYDSAVKTQNAQFRIYDRSDINKAASGVTTKAAEVVHPNITTGVNNGSGATTWSTPAGSAVTITLTASPGISGQRPNGSNTTAAQHDWYMCISASPDSVGSKTLYGGYFSCEYL